MDDISQPDNGAQLSTGDGEMTDSDSEISAKEEEYNNEEDPPETLYFPNEEEEFGDAGAQVKINRKCIDTCFNYDLNTFSWKG